MNKEIEISPRQIAQAITDLLDEKEKLLKENNQLKERIRILTEHPFLSKIRKEDKNVIKELRRWLEEEYFRSDDYSDYETAFKMVLNKLNELEGGDVDE